MANFLKNFLPFSQPTRILKTSYTFTTTLDENNKLYYAKLDGKAYTGTLYQGNESKFIIKGKFKNGYQRN